MPSEMEILSAGEWSDAGKQQEQQQQGTPGEIVGTSQTTSEVLVRTPDGKMTWQKTDTGTVEHATKVINENERIRESNKGIEETNKWIEAENYKNKQLGSMYAMGQAPIIVAAEHQENALDKLKDYKTIEQINPVTGKERGVSYDVAEYLWKHPEDTTTLIRAGFDRDNVEKISVSVEGVRKEVNSLDKQIKTGKISIAETYAFIDAYREVGGLPKADVNKRTLEKVWNKLSDQEKRELSVRYAKDELKGNLWSSTQGRISLNEAQGYLDQGKNMTPFDVAVAGAGIAIVYVPVIGGVGGRIIGGVSGAVLTAKTVKDWNKMASWEKGLSIAGDAVTLSGVPGGAVSGARNVQAAGTAARLKGAATGAFKSAFPEGGIEGLEPQTMVVVKRGKNALENAFNPKKIPEVVVTTSNGTVRFPVNQATTAKEAMQIRDKLMDLAAKGEKPIVKIDGKEVELSRSPLMQANKGGLAHATPQGEAFEKGLIVTRKEGMSVQEQGLFVANEPLPRFTTTSAFGKTGEKPVFYITSPETAKKAVSTGKVYAGTTEMEKKFPVGFTLPEPKQKLFTRINGNRVEIWLEKPLSKTAIAKLKAQSLVYGVKTIAEPSINIKGLKAKGLTKAQAEELASTLKESGERRIARTISRSYESIRETQRDNLNRNMVEAERLTGREVGRDNEGRFIRMDSTRARELERLGNTERINTSRTNERLPDTVSRVDSARVDGAERLSAERTTTNRIEPISEKVPGRTNPTERINTPDRVTFNDRTVRPEDRIFPNDRRPPTQSTNQQQENRLLPPVTTAPRDEGITDKSQWPKGTITWRQGSLELNKSRPGAEAIFKIVPPPYNKKYTKLEKPIEGMTNPYGRTPKETVQAVGGNVRSNVNIPMGIVTVHAQANDREITFTRRNIRTGSPGIMKPHNSSAGRGPGRARSGRFASRNVGNGVYHTRVGKGTILSRRPLK